MVLIKNVLPTPNSNPLTITIKDWYYFTPFPINNKLNRIDLTINARPYFSRVVAKSAPLISGYYDFKTLSLVWSRDISDTRNVNRAYLTCTRSSTVRCASDESVGPSCLSQSEEGTRGLTWVVKERLTVILWSLITAVKCENWKDSLKWLNFLKWKFLSHNREG